MTVTIGPYEFSHHSYDAFGDILYLRVVAGQSGVSADDGSDDEGWLYPFEGGNEVVGLDLQSPKYRLERDGEIAVRLPGGSVVKPDLASLLH